MLEQVKVVFPGGEVKSGGQAFVRVIVDCLWYLDGHHDALRSKVVQSPRCLAVSMGTTNLNFQNIENDVFLTFVGLILRCYHLPYFLIFRNRSGHRGN